MKKVIVSIMVALMLLAVAPLPVNASPKNATTLVAEPAVANTVESDALLLRLNEIKSMDKSNLSSSEKKGLRKEVKSIEANSCAMVAGYTFLEPVQSSLSFFLLFYLLAKTLLFG